MNTFCVGFLLIACLAANWIHAYDFPWDSRVNDLGGPMNFNCPNGQIITYLYSIYDTSYRDRVWWILCDAVRFNSDCVQSDWINNWHQHFSYNCPDQKVLTGIESYYDKSFADRRFKFTCCLANRYPAHTECKNTPPNQFNESLTANVPQGFGIGTVDTEFSDVYNDRKYSFLYCKILGTPLRR